MFYFIITLSNVLKLARFFTQQSSLWKCFLNFSREIKWSGDTWSRPSVSICFDNKTTPNMSKDENWHCCPKVCHSLFKIISKIIIVSNFSRVWKKAILRNEVTTLLLHLLSRFVRQKELPKSGQALVVVQTHCGSTSNFVLKQLNNQNVNLNYSLWKLCKNWI